MAKRQPIRVGDKFKQRGGVVVEVIETKPGGKVELFDRERTRFHSRWTREMRDWDRVTKATAT